MASVSSITGANIYNNGAMTSLSFPSLTGTVTTNNFSGNSGLSSVDLGSVTAFTAGLNFNGCGLTSFTMPSSVSACPGLTLSSPNLTSVDLGNITEVNVIVYSCPLAPAILGLSNITSVRWINLTSDNYTQSQVDGILSECLTISTRDSSCSLSLGGNAKPSTAGYVDKATLISRGWTVLTN
jgi:hypothetical protein